MNPEKISMIEVSAQTVTDTSRGEPSLAYQDILGQLSKLSEGACLYARIKYGLETNHSYRLSQIMHDKVDSWRDNGSWRITRPDYLLSLCQLALNEAVGENVCPWCRGQASRLVRHKKIECSPCKGSGKFIVRARHRAEYMDISEASWANTWKDRYIRILDITYNWENEIYSLKSGL